MEYFLFPKNTYYLTQGYGDNSFSHQGRYALDVSAAGGGSPKIFAPFTGYVAKTYVNNKDAYTIWLVSKDKVLCADGKYYYAVMELGHPREIASYKEGDTFKQGDYILNDGDTGMATGKHLDIEIAVYNNKEDIKVGFYKTNKGTYSLINSVNPCDYLVLKNNTKVLNDVYNGQKYYIKKEDEVIKDTDQRLDKGVYKTLGNMRVRTGPGTEYPQKLVKDLSADGKNNATSKDLNALAFYKKGTLFDALEIITYSKRNVWAKTYSGYVNILNGIETNCEKVADF